MNGEPSAKPKPSREEARARDADRLQAIRLRMAVYRALDDRGITPPSGIGAALDLPAAEATALLSRKVLREGDLAQLVAAAARLGVQDSG